MSKDFTVPLTLTDTYLTDDFPTNNYQTNIYTAVGAYISGDAYRSILIPKFDNLPSGLTFSGGRLFITPVTKSSNYARTMYIHRILKNTVLSQATWNIFSTGNNWDSAGCSNSSSDYDGSVVIGSVEVSATPTMNTPIEITLSSTEFQKFYDGTYTNNGFVLFKDTQFEDCTFFASMEYSTVAYRPYFEIDFSVPFTSQYPPAHNDTYVKATTKFSTSYWPYYATDPSKSLTGAMSSNCWMAQSSVTTNQRFHIDLGEEKVIKNIYYENFHNSGASTNGGVKDFTFWGSNDAGSFAELTYGTDAGWTQLTTSASSLLQHADLDLSHPNFVTVTNSTPYRYYAFKFANNYGNGSYFGIRHIELQTEDGWPPDGTPTYVPGVIWF